MAYRKSKGKARRSKKIEPAVMRMTFSIPTDSTGAATTQYLDLSLAASIANRRFYRQGINWAVAGIKLTAKGTGSVRTSKVPTTWSASNAWEKSFRMWQKMNDQVLDDEPSIQGRYHDFKVYADATMVGAAVQQAGFTGLGPFVLTPVDSAGALTQGDYTGAVSPRADWEYSKIQIPNDPTTGLTDEHFMHFVGPEIANVSVGLIEGYARSRSRPQTSDPNVPLGEGWMNELFDLGENNEEIRDDLVDDNDRPPYAVKDSLSTGEFYPGGSQEFPNLQYVEFSEFTATTVSATNHVAGGQFPCGLIRFDIDNDATTGGGTGFQNLLIQVDLVPGHHRGYLCEPMTEM